LEKSTFLLLPEGGGLLFELKVKKRKNCYFGGKTVFSSSLKEEDNDPAPWLSSSSFSQAIVL